MSGAGRVDARLDLRDGDIFRWRYTEEEHARLSRWGNPYHCTSCVAVFREGFLRDTYWMTNSDGKVWSQSVAADELVLEFVANFNDLRKANEGDANYYDDADCVNLNHANSKRGNFYLRKLAVRSAIKMREMAVYEREREIAAAFSALSHASRLQDVIRRIDQGEPLDGIWL